MSDENRYHAYKEIGSAATQFGKGLKQLLGAKEAEAKPSRILIYTSNQWLVADFGITMHEMVSVVVTTAYEKSHL
jgi:long-subunit acyl-CoA synthetase (AMP-forming)